MNKDKKMQTTSISIIVKTRIKYLIMLNPCDYTMIY